MSESKLANVFISIGKEIHILHKDKPCLAVDFVGRLYARLSFCTVIPCNLNVVSKGATLHIETIPNVACDVAPLLMRAT